MRKRKRGEWFAVSSFLIVGVANALIDIGVLNALVRLFPTTDAVRLSAYNTIAYASAVTNSYIWNARITFRPHATFRFREKLGFAAQALLALGVNNGVFLAGVAAFGALDGAVPHWLGINAAKGFAMALSSASSFFLMKYVVFSTKRP